MPQEGHVITHESEEEFSLLLAEALRRVAFRELRSAIQALKDQKHPHSGIHETRKAIRRLRSVLHLVWEGRRGTMKRIDRDLKKMARGLSSVRDAHVVLALARERKATCNSVSAAVQWQRAASTLTSRRNRLLKKLLADDVRFGARIASLKKHSDAIELLPWQTVRASQVQSVLQKTLMRAAEAEQQYLLTHTVEHKHTWRRRLRAYRMQLLSLHSALLALEQRAKHPSQSLLGTWLTETMRQLPELESQIDALGAGMDLDLLRNALKHLRKRSPQDDWAALLGDASQAVTHL